MKWHGYIDGEEVCASRWSWLCRWKLLRLISQRSELWVTICVRRN